VGYTPSRQHTSTRCGAAWRGVAWRVGRGAWGRKTSGCVRAPRRCAWDGGVLGCALDLESGTTHTGAGDKVGATHTRCAHPEAKPGVDAGGRTRRARAVACCVPVSLAARAARHVALVAAAALAGP